MNWTLLTTILLTLSNPFNLGLACGNDTGTTQVQFDKIEVQVQTDEKSVTVTQTLGPDGGSIVVDFMGQPRVIKFAPTALLYEVPIKMTVTTAVNKTYFNDPNLNIEHGVPELVSFIGSQIILEIPSNALNWQNVEILKALIGLSPGFNDGVVLNTLDSHIRAEVRIWSANNEPLLLLDSYRVSDDFAVVRAGDLQIGLRSGSSDIILISVQVVDRSRVIKRNMRQEGMNNLGVDDTPLALYEEVLFKLDGNYSKFSNCGNQHETMPTGTNPITELITDALDWQNNDLLKELA